MAANAGYGMTAGGDGRLRASTADRERAADVLKAGFAEGRLTKDEYDGRVSQAFAARTYADLASVTADLPGGQVMAPYMVPYPRPTVAPGTNGFAVASLACGLAQPFTGGLTMIPAIVFGHVARSQIRRNGDGGGGLALAGLLLGWAGLLLVLLTILLVVVAFSWAGT
jgi:uncharacterized membrane protein